jgi:hypothetical protein
VGHRQRGVHLRQVGAHVGIVRVDPGRAPEGGLGPGEIAEGHPASPGLQLGGQAPT